jgi:hypothetical protein
MVPTSRVRRFSSWTSLPSLTCHSSALSTESATRASLSLPHSALSCSILSNRFLTSCSIAASEASSLRLTASRQKPTQIHTHSRQRSNPRPGALTWIPSIDCERIPSETVMQSITCPRAQLSPSPMMLSTSPAPPSSPAPLPSSQPLRSSSSPLPAHT